MIETLEALDCVEEIAAVDGVDSLLIGSNDLTAEMGIPGQYEDERFTEAFRRTISACQRVGKWVGVGGLHARLDLVEKFCQMGANWVMAATDGPLLLGGATKRASEMAAVNAKVIAGSRAIGKQSKGGVNGAAPEGRHINGGSKVAPGVEVAQVPLQTV